MGKGNLGRELRIGYLRRGVACEASLSRRRLATSRDMGWKMASPTEGKSRLGDCCPVVSLFAALGTSDVFTLTLLS